MIKHSRKKVTQKILTVFWVIVFIYFTFSVFVVSIGQNVFSEEYSGKFKRNIKSILPQGWGFFTRNPLEEKYKFYSVENGTLVLANERNSSSANFLGLSRKYRRYGYEFTQIYSNISKGGWKEPKSNKLQSIQFYGPDTLQTRDTFKTIKPGKYIIIKYKEVPWAWAGRVNEGQITKYACVILNK